MTLFSLLRLNNDSLRILAPYYRCEQERLEEDYTNFVKARIQDHVSPTSDLSFLTVVSLLYQMKMVTNAIKMRCTRL